MKKRNIFGSALSLAMVVIMLLGLGSVTAFAYISEQATKSTGVWTEISESYYAPISIEGSNQIVLRRTLQESDYEQILESLVDTSIPADTAAAENAATNPDAYLPDNMLPDGRVLRSDWQTAQLEMISNAQKLVTLNNNKIQSTDIADKMSLSANDDAKYTMQLAMVDGQQYILPETSRRSLEIIPETHESIFYDDRGIRLIDPQTQSTSELLPSIYKGKTFDELSAEMIQRGDESSLVWSNQVSLNNAGTKLAYISNKENLSTYSVFMYDIETAEEYLVQTSTDYNYLIIGWINNDTVLCYKLKGLGLDVVAIDSAGNEQNIVLETDDPDIIDISGELIAYRGPGSNEVWISKYNETESPDLITHIDLQDGVVCVMAGAEEFNSTGDKFAFIYSPNALSKDRYLWTVDLSTSEINKEMTLPTIKSEVVGVHDFAWKNSDELIVNIYAQEDESNETISTWNYTIGGGS